MALMPVIKIASRPTQPASGEADIREIKDYVGGSRTFKYFCCVEETK
jgi:hypothetical protein